MSSGPVGWVGSEAHQHGVRSALRHRSAPLSLAGTHIVGARPPAVLWEAAFALWNSAFQRFEGRLEPERGRPRSRFAPWRAALHAARARGGGRELSIFFPSPNFPCK